MARRSAEQIRIDRARADQEEAKAREPSIRRVEAEQRAGAKPAASGSSSEGGGSSRSIRSRLPGNPPTALVASETVTLIAISAYDFLGPKGDGTGKLPDPRPIVAVLVFWGLLGLVGSISRGLETGVAWVGWILTSTVLVQGARGKGLILFIQKLSSFVAPNTQTG